MSASTLLALLAAALPAATPLGPPLKCLNISAIRQTIVRDDRTIDFVTSGRRVYRNSLPQSCPELGFERAFSYATSLSVLCDVGIITVLRQSTPLRQGASCGLGQFQPIATTGR